MEGEIDCRKASALLSRAQERALSPAESISLRYHLSMCGMCRQFENQLAFLRKAAQRFRGKD